MNYHGEKMNGACGASWITYPSIQNWEIRNVFHRQLDKKVVDIDPGEQNLHILFRREFELPCCDSMFLTISADDYYKLYINGQFVTQGPAPGYPSRYFYNEIEVSDFLHPGRNLIAVHTYYQGLINRVWVSGDRRHGLFLKLSHRGQTVLASDESFRCALHSGFQSCGITGYDTQFLEHYDCRAPETGFEKTDFDDKTWIFAAVRKNSDWQLVRQPSKQLCFQKLAPEVMIRTNNRVFLDFGAVNVGYLHFCIKGQPGSTVRMQFAQELESDGSLRYKLRANCEYQSLMTLSGKDDELVEFDYKTFRYALLILPDGAALRDDSVCFILRHYPFELKAECNADDEKSRQIWQLCVDTLHYGVQEVIQDCMEREKGYYLGDGCYTIWSYTLLTRDYTLIEKFFDDFLESRFINRGLMTCGCCSKMQEIAEYPLIFVLLFKIYLFHSKRLDFVRQRYALFADMMDYYAETYADSDGLLHKLDKWCVVEWPAEYRDNYDADIREGKVCEVKHNVINAYYIGAVKCMNQIASMLGLPPYRDEKSLEENFIKAFYIPEKHLFKDSVESDHISSVGNIYAAFFGLLPDQECKEAIIGLINTKRFSGSNFFATVPMLAFLKIHGQEDLMQELLHSENAWLNIIREGGKRTFEGWGKDSKFNTSLFHLTMSLGILFLTDWGLDKILDFSPRK